MFTITIKHIGIWPEKFLLNQIQKWPTINIGNISSIWVISEIHNTVLCISGNIEKTVPDS